MLPLRLRDADSAGERAQRERGVPWRTLLGAGVVALLAVRGLDALGSSSHHVGLPILGDLREPTNAAGVAGVLWMAWAAGMLVGSLAVRPLLARPMDRAPSLVFYASTVVMSGGFIGIF